MTEHALFGDQLMLAAVTSWAIERLKQAPWFPLLKADSDKAARVAAALVSTLATAGILVGHTWDPSTHALGISITGLTLAHVADFLYHGVAQYIFTKGVYHIGVKPAMNGGLPPAKP